MEVETLPLDFLHDEGTFELSSQYLLSQERWFILKSMKKSVRLLTVV